MYLVGLVIYAFPLLSIMLGGLGYLISRNVYLIPGAVLTVALIATYTVFNSSFLMWVVIYTILSYIAGLAVKTLDSTSKQESQPNYNFYSPYSAIGCHCVIRL